ncbi:histidine kinase [Agromyces atrinae]|uniref:sensor histidine kinase n=1 Tax=Agromyces atrinae TaxID=592376 RepID=UPI001F5A33D5|nr:histidine kinase [Agromyces atrinae]MCI2957332.1 histidine kinase [Agromyces atrinae]
MTRSGDSHTALPLPTRPPRRGFWAYAPAARWTQLVVPLLAVSGLLFDIVAMLVAEPDVGPGPRIVQIGIAVLYTFGLILLPYIVTWAAAVVLVTAFISVPWAPPDVPASTLVLTMGFVVALTPRAFIATFGAATLAWAIVVVVNDLDAIGLVLLVVASAFAAAGIGYAVRRILIDRADTAARARLLRAELAVAAVEQRRLIAHELHDVVAHHITVIRMVSNMGLRAADGRSDSDLLDTIGSSASTALEELRRLLRVLDPGGGESDSSGGVAARRLGEQVERVASDLRTAGVDVVTEIVDDADRGIPEAVTVTLERILIEATTNVLKHGDTTGCRILLERDGRRMVLEVSNRVGTAPHRPGGEASGYGVPGMRRRAAEFGGTVEAGESDGIWVVRAVVPLSP